MGTLIHMVKEPSTEERLEEFKMTRRANARVNIYKAYPKGSGLRKKLGQCLIKDLSIPKLYREYGMLRFGLRELDERGRETGRCTLNPDRELMKKVMESIDESKVNA